MMYLWLKRLHSWLGISAGVFMAVVGLTGALMAFEPQVLKTINPQLQLSEAQAPNWAALAQWGQDHQASWSALTLDSQSLSAAEAKVQRAGQADTVMLQPVSGEVLEPARGHDVFEAVEQLHRNLLLGAPGKAVTGVVAILLVGMLLGGLSLRLLKHPKRFTTWFVLRRGLPSKARHLQWHSVIGTWCFLTLLFSALTGLWWSYEGYQKAIHEVAGVTYKPKEKPPAIWRDSATFLPQARMAWSVVMQLDPAATKVRVVTSDAGLQVTYWLPDAEHIREENTVKLSAQGDVLSHQRFREKPASEQLLKSWKMLHTGQYWGWLGQLVLALSALGLVYLFVLGWRLFVKDMRAS